MADGMSFDKYIDNPSGGASVVTARRMYKEMYTQKFNAVLLREQGKIKYKIFKAKDKTDSYYIYIKVPSEVISKFYYDVVIKLYTTESAKKSSAWLREYAVGFYSNDPAFVYTFAYSFRKNKLFINELASVMSKSALEDKASVRNPDNQVWYVKSLYFAYLTMEKYHLFSRAVLDASAKSFDIKALTKDIMPADKKIQLRQKAEEKLRAEKKKEREAEARAKQRAENEKRNVGVRAKSTAKVSTTKHTKIAKSSKSTTKSKIAKTTSMNKK